MSASNIDTPNGTQTISLTDMIDAANKRNVAAQQNALKAQQDYSTYLDGSRNAIADIIAQQKPVRHIQDENRQKEVAKWAAISEGISAIGKSIAHYNGVHTQPTQNKALISSMNKLHELDNIYQQQGYKYNQSLLTDAMRTQNRNDNIQDAHLQTRERQARIAQTQLDGMQQLALEQQLEKEQLAEQRAHNDKNRREDKAHTWARAKYIAGADKKQEPIQEPIEYYISLSNGHTAPIRRSDETTLLQWAQANGESIDTDMLAKPKDSPERRLEIQKLYQKHSQWEIENKYGPSVINNNGIKAPDQRVFTLRALDNVLLPIISDKNEKNKENTLIHVLSQYPDDIVQMWLDKNL